jgi:hypothetical protein
MLTDNSLQRKISMQTAYPSSPNAGSLVLK